MFGGDSQLFGGATQLISQGGSPSRGAQGGAGRQDEKQICLPVTVRLLEAAAAKTTGDGAPSIHGIEPAFVVIVGVVEALTRQATGLEFSINDATGRLRVRYFSSDTSALDAIGAGIYVTVVGAFRSSPAPHVSAQWVRPCDCADQVSYHAIEVAHAALRIQKGTHVPEPSPSPLSEAAPKTMEPAALPTAQAKVDDSAAPHVQTPLAVATPARAVSAGEAGVQGPGLKSSVLAALKQAAGKEEGLSTSELMAQLPGTQESALRSVLVQLVDGGDVYNTIDEEHFALL